MSGKRDQNVKNKKSSSRSLFHSALAITMSLVMLFGVCGMMLDSYADDGDATRQKTAQVIDANTDAAESSGETAEAVDTDNSVGTATENSTDNKKDIPDPQSEKIDLVYENDEITVTVSAEEDTLPKGASIEAEEILPTDEENADTYAKALTSLSSMLRDEDKSFKDAKVYDIRILDKEGKEIEPDGKVLVSIEYKEGLKLSAGKKADIRIAHVPDKEDAEILDADLQVDGDGALENASFTTDSFSAYIVFDQTGVSTTEPANIGNYGWIKFRTSGDQDTTQDQTADPDSTAIQWGYYRNASILPDVDTDRKSVV